MNALEDIRQEMTDQEIIESVCGDTGREEIEDDENTSDIVNVPPTTRSNCSNENCNEIGTISRKC